MDNRCAGRLDAAELVGRDVVAGPESVTALRNRLAWPALPGHTARAAKPERRLVRQLDMSIEAMLDDLPRACDRGTKRNARGHTTSWIGYKLHIDTADSGIPISCVLTSASVHDSQVAIPLATITAKRVTSCSDLMDSAYEAAEIRQHSETPGHVPIINAKARGKGAQTAKRVA